MAASRSSRTRCRSVDGVLHRRLIVMRQSMQDFGEFARHDPHRNLGLLLILVRLNRSSRAPVPSKPPRRSAGLGLLHVSSRVELVRLRQLTAPRSATHKCGRSPMLAEETRAFSSSTRFHRRQCARRHSSSATSNECDATARQSRSRCPSPKHDQNPTSYYFFGSIAISRCFACHS